MDFSTYLVDDILVKVDRASMLASLEVRAPFLDYRIIEFAFRKVPDHLRVWGKSGKFSCAIWPNVFFRPLWIVNRKQGFAIPLSHWLKGSGGLILKKF